mgnify:CR=1 FL=1
MRAFDIAIAALALRTSATRPPRHERRLVPAIDDAGQATLDRNAVDQRRAALAASLWPEARPCAVRAIYELLPAPAQFTTALSVQWAAPAEEHARALQARLAVAFPCTEAAIQAENFRAA